MAWHSASVVADQVATSPHSGKEVNAVPTAEGMHDLSARINTTSDATSRTLLAWVGMGVTGFHGCCRGQYRPSSIRYCTGVLFQ